MDEEELQKRFTDCVYFLASPLTCKKGFECEYRHSEIARLNPRDCWYWLSGCCFNPDCAFRHPPLEGLKEPYHEPSNLNNAPMDKSHKTNIPCYFYSKGFCNKGEQCSFLHGPADVIITPKPSKPTPTVKNPITTEKKSSEESKTESVQVKILQNPPETEKVEHSNTVKEHTQDSDQESSESTDVSESQSQENVSESQSQENVSESQENSSRSNSLGEQEEFVQSESDVFNDQSSGFDVLVNGEETERFGCGFDQNVDFFDGHVKEGEYNIGYDSFYQKSENGYVKERFDEVYEPLEKVESRKSIFCRLSFKKRNLEHEKPVFNGRKGCDLREHLKRRKVVDYGFTQGYDGNFRRYPQRKGHVPVNRNRVSLKDNRNRVSLKDRKPQFMKQKRRIKEKGDDVFKGPKSLDEIKEEKRKDGFQGPRSLSEILENKRKVG